jgi:hypothetical protein
VAQGVRYFEFIHRPIGQTDRGVRSSTNKGGRASSLLRVNGITIPENRGQHNRINEDPAVICRFISKNGNVVTIAPVIDFVEGTFGVYPVDRVPVAPGVAAEFVNLMNEVFSGFFDPYSVQTRVSVGESDIMAIITPGIGGGFAIQGGHHIWLGRLPPPGTTDRARSRDIVGEEFGHLLGLGHGEGQRNIPEGRAAGFMDGKLRSDGLVADHDEIL